MAISIPKIEILCIQHPQAPQPPHETLTLHDWSWTPTPIPIKLADPSDSTRYLGAQVTFGDPERQSFKWCKDHLRTTAAILQIKRATGQCRQKVIELQLVPQILYKAAHATWPLKHYRELDRILAHAIRQMYRLPPSYPTALIFLPKTDCGLNTEMGYAWQSICTRVRPSCGCQGAHRQGCGHSTIHGSFCIQPV
jgi:hypothetical protein